MSTTCQDVINRAKSYSQLNASLASDSVDMLTRIRSIQQRVFTATAQLGRARFTRVQSINSNNAASARTIDLTTLSPALERLLRLTITSGTVELNQVPDLDTDAAFSPRFFIRGTNAVEVGSDWGASGIVAVELTYVYGASAITVTASPSSVNVTVPDEWIDVLVVPLAMYLHQRDPGRDPLEGQRLEREYRAAWDAYLQYLTNYGGLAHVPGRMPAPPEIALDARTQ